MGVPIAGVLGNWEFPWLRILGGIWGVPTTPGIPPNAPLQHPNTPQMIPIPFGTPHCPP